MLESLFNEVENQRASGTQDPNVGPRTQDPQVEPYGGTLRWNAKVGP